MRELSIDDFDSYYAEVHGQGAEPFPWQRRLMHAVANEGSWPSLLDLPTGSGKTTALDIAVFAQALDAARPPTERRAPRRVVLVVDRRTIVDQAHERAMKLSRALRDARPEAAPVLSEVAERLAGIGGDPASSAAPVSPLGVYMLRGGMPRDDDWARSPTRPLIAVSTVDQVGSRLLFRGYGLSPRMAPVHAGLLANDVLFLLDEVHLARPFRDLLVAVKERYRSFASAGLPDRWQVVQMSATPGTSLDDHFGLDEQDRGHPVLAARLRASKPVTLRGVKTSGSEEARKRALAQAVAKEAETRWGNAKTLGIVVNRVQTARFVFDALKKLVQDKGGERYLVTGRMRPVDRDELERRLKTAVGSDRDRDVSKPCIVVATQCIEAGADFDFDCLLTECASLDALRQRFGRLNRLGLSASTEGVLFAREDQVDDKASADPVYGTALKATWEYLSGLGSVDFGLERLSLPMPDRLAAVLAPARSAPMLLPAHLDAWVQTTPAPLADPEPGLWFHGAEPLDLEVSVVWRADLDESTLAGLPIDEHRGSSPVPDWLDERLEACPPRSIEALAVPLAACRAWLRLEAASEMTDAGALPTDAERPRETHPGERRAVVWRQDQRLVVRAAGVQPGDAVLVPSSYGGLNEGTWAPEANEPVADVGDWAQLWQRGRVQVRLDRNVIALGLAAKQEPPALPGLDCGDDAEADPVEIALEYVREVERHATQSWLRVPLSGLLQARRAELRLVEMAGDSTPRAAPHYALVRRRPMARKQLRRLASEFAHAGRHGADPWESLDPSLFDETSDDDHSSLMGVEVTLHEHSDDVARLAACYSAAAGLSGDLCRILELAGHLHDLGKTDPRFQRWLHQGSAFRASVAKELLAKSTMPAQDRATRERARRRAGYPKGARHELMSLALLAQADALKDQAGPDWDLLLYLVSSHHGSCRPFAPHVPDPEPVAVSARAKGTRLEATSAHGLERLDSGVPDRFWQLVRRYGWFGLAWLEALFRLADHRASESEAERKLAEPTEERDHAA